MKTELKYYDIVRARVKPVLEYPNNLRAPLITTKEEWFSLKDEQTADLKSYMQAVRKHTSSIPEGISQEDKQLMNANSALDLHVDIVSCYLQKLPQCPAFQQQYPTINQNFMKALAYMHDFSRNIFNGPFPLTYVDQVSDGLTRTVFPTFPKEYMHTIDWMTGRKNPPQMQYKSPDQVAIMLKALDTLGKIDQNGRLLDPDDFFAENGPYEKWKQRQIDLKRFPLKIVHRSDSLREQNYPRIDVDIETYVERDKYLTYLGVGLLEEFTGKTFGELRDEVQEDMQPAITAHMDSLAS
jgi:hypothetical protein